MRQPFRSFHRVVTACCTILAACGEDAPVDARAPGTQRMVALLEDVAADFEKKGYPYAAVARLDALATVREPSDLRGRLIYSATVAEHLLHAGRIEESAERFAAIAEEIGRHGDRVPPDFTRTMRELLGTAYFQLAHRSRCVQPGGIDGCLAPPGSRLSPSGPRGVREALMEWSAILALEPDHLGIRWLLNLTYMAGSAYPDSVPGKWLIPPDAFQSEYDIKRFPDVAPEAGVAVLAHAGGSIMDDFDGDGHLDVIASSWGVRDQLRYFRNEGNGTFTDRTAAAGLVGIVGGLNIVQADYDNDGRLDLLVLRGGWMPEGHPNSLLRNNGDETFADVTDEAGLLAPWYPTQTASWGDYDNDGWLDLFVGNESPEGSRNPSQLFRNNGDGTFSDVAAAVGADVVGFIKGVVWGDVNNDGLLDVFLSRRGQPNVLLRNAGPDSAGRWRFVDISAEAGVTDPIDSFPTWFWDYDNDGWLDLFVSGYRSQFGDVAAEYLGRPHGSEFPRLYRNTGDGTFRDVTKSVRLDRIMAAMGANFGDLDNDGYPDVYAATGDMDFRALVPNRMFRNAAAARFQDVTTAGGFGHLQKGHGVSFGDIDNDGDQDIYAVMGGAYDGDVAYNVLLENPGHDNRSITLRLEGVRSNRSAIGARIKVTVTTSDGSRDVYTTVSSGGSFGANSLQQEIGLGRATAIRSVAVTWPTTGRTDVFERLELDRIYLIREGDAAPTEMRP